MNRGGNERVAPDRKHREPAHPIAPTGANPTLHLSPERRPAAMLAGAEPTAVNAVRRPIPAIVELHTSAPKQHRDSWRSAPRNQKYEMPITVSHRPDRGEGA